MRLLICALAVVALTACSDSESGPSVGDNSTTNNSTTTTNNSTTTTNNQVVNNSSTNNTATGEDAPLTATEQRCAGGGVMSGGGYIAVNCSGPTNVGSNAAQGGEYRWEPGASKILFR